MQIQVREVIILPVLFTEDQAGAISGFKREFSLLFILQPQWSQVKLSVFSNRRLRRPLSATP